MADEWTDLGSITTRLEKKPNWVRQPEINFNYLRRPVQYPGSTMEMYEVYDDLPMTIQYGYGYRTQTEFYTILDFFNGRKGRLKKFWLPVYMNLFTMYSAFNKSTQIVVTDTQFNKVYRGYERLFLELKTGDRITRKITHVADNGNGTETLTLNSLINRVIAITDIAFLSRMLLVRLAEDSFGPDPQSIAVGDYNLTFIELVREYASL